MRTVRFRCRKCGHEGKVEILTREEQKDPRIPKRRIACPRCGSSDLDIG